jgi:TonB-linked SusC/RagA family outer membrane protein
MKQLLLFLFCVAVAIQVHGQSLTVSGTILDADNNTPLPGVSILVKGTANGTFTDTNGKFSLEVATGATLAFSFIGYSSQEIVVTNQTVIDLSLAPNTKVLSEVAVTALGIKREKRALGYAVSDVMSEDIAGNGEPNPISSIAGKVAGVSISSTTAGPTGSSRVLIRGIRELQGSNQPLYVIDGVPAVNGNIGSANQGGGFDLGDGLADINPNDIQSITVLKGASAAALYGSRALNGVVLITTKNGQSKRGIGIEYTGSVTIDQIATKLDERQKTYGQGSNGLLPRAASEANNITSNWGPRFDEATSIIQRDGTIRPYTYLEDNVQDFFRSGVTSLQTLSLTGGNETSNVRLSYSNVSNKDIIPTSGYGRNTFALRAETKITKALTVEGKVSYMAEQTDNRPALTDDVNNIGNGLIGLAGNFDQAWLKTYANEDGSYIDYTGNQYRANPYWTINRTRNESDKKRISGYMAVDYKFNDMFSLNLKAGTDFYNFNFQNFYDKGTPTRAGGVLLLNDLKVREDNFQGFVNFRKALGSSFKLLAMAGGNLMKYDNEQTIIQGSEIVAPGKALITNFKEVKILPYHPRKEIRSVFGSTELSFKEYLFLNLQARNDWSSTLPSGNNSYFYPSADLSFVITDAFPVQSAALTFAKIRTSLGQVGSDTDPYKTRFLYTLTGTSIDGKPMGEILGDVIPNGGLKPQRKTSFEVGADVRLLNDRIGLDFTYYHEVTRDVLLDFPIPGSAGFSAAALNGATLKNHGVEILLRTTPVKLSNGFEWDLTFNFSKNHNTIVDLYEGLEAYRVAEARWAGATILAEKGKPFGTIMGNAFLLDNQGRRIHGADGMPLFTDAPVEIGNSLPDWTGGLISTFSYKGIELKAALDIRVGGDIFSMTNMTMHSSGAHSNTEAGRESWNEYQQERRAAEEAATADGFPEEDVDDPTSAYYVAQGGRGYIGEGVKENGEVNDVKVSPAAYWGAITNNIPQPFVYDASYIKLRDISISYNLPGTWLKKTPFQAVTISAIGRNLWIIHKNTPNIDPESNYNNGNGQGFEYGSLPGRKRYGFNLTIKF